MAHMNVNYPAAGAGRPAFPQAAALGATLPLPLGSVGGGLLGAPNLHSLGVGVQAALGGPVPNLAGAAGLQALLQGAVPNPGIRPAAKAKPALAPEAAKKPEEVPRCHLHKKAQRSCKFCQRAENAKKEAQEEAAAALAKKRDAAAAQKKERKFNCSPLLLEQVLSSSYYRMLMNVTNLEDLIEEIHQFGADTLDVYRTALEPSCFMCAVYRLFTLEHSEEELRAVIDHPDYVVVRCAGFLFLRCTLAPEQLWERLEEFVLDDAQLPEALAEIAPTVGEYIEALLLREKYYNTPLPRIPAAVSRKLEEHIAPLSQYRKRARANQRHFQDARGGQEVEALVEGEWRAGRVTKVLDEVPSRLRVRVALTPLESSPGGGETSTSAEPPQEVVVHIGFVVLSGGSPDPAAGKGRGRSPDWSRHKGKSTAELLEEIREKQRSSAVCSDRKEYAKRPLCFEGALAIKREQGSAEARLTEEETRIVSSSASTSRRRPTEEEEEEQERKRRRRTEEEEERQRKLKDIFEKYGQQRSTASGKGPQSSDLEGPDKMRLG